MEISFHLLSIYVPLIFLLRAVSFGGSSTGNRWCAVLWAANGHRHDNKPVGEGRDGNITITAEATTVRGRIYYPYNINPNLGCSWLTTVCRRSSSSGAYGTLPRRTWRHASMQRSSSREPEQWLSVVVGQTADTNGHM